jgi:Hg(II)-responsive transcriptional regulator
MQLSFLEYTDPTASRVRRERLLTVPIGERREIYVAFCCTGYLSIGFNPDRPQGPGVLTIGQVAKQAGVSVETIRFYERQALISTPQRSESGYRLYTPEAIKRVRFIRRAKDLGFSLKDIRELLSLSASPTACCKDVKQQAMLKIEDINNRILDLERVRNALLELADQCVDEADSREECPILKALYKKLSFDFVE